jgi:hypothetical protein
MGERESTGRGPFTVTESDCKPAPCRLRINAVADDRGFVALEASGSDDLQKRGAGPGAAGRRLMKIVQRDNADTGEARARNPWRRIGVGARRWLTAPSGREQL